MQFGGFQHYIRNWYELYGRHELPWRLTYDPYAILVSELMLQQTQVERVIPKYNAFLQQFPTVKALSCAELAEVIIAWQGLGYNRRAKYLWQAAKIIQSNGGTFPQTEAELSELPGIGSYTAAAIACFSYNLSVILIETNIRTVFLYHFFPQKLNVHDQEILPLIEESLDTVNPREWYWALMDYGSHLKKIFPNPNRASRQYNKQSSFVGSKRQVRGEILRLLATTPTMNTVELQQRLQSNANYLETALESLKIEGFIHEQAGHYSLAKDTV